MQEVGWSIRAVLQCIPAVKLLATMHDMEPAAAPASLNANALKHAAAAVTACTVMLLVKPWVMPVQVATAVADAVGPELTGIRLSPFSTFQECTDPETLDLNLYLVDKLAELGLLYVHAVEPRISGASDAEIITGESLEPLRKAFKVLVACPVCAAPCCSAAWETAPILAAPRMDSRDTGGFCPSWQATRATMHLHWAASANCN
jgi:hypothetical protein